MLTFRYGLIDNHDKSVPETARALNMDPVEVSRMERKAIRKLKSIVKGPKIYTKLYNVVIWKYPLTAKWAVMEEIRRIRPHWGIKQLSKAADRENYTFRKLTQEQALDMQQRLETAGVTVKVEVR